MVVKIPTYICMYVCMYLELFCQAFDVKIWLKIKHYSNRTTNIAIQYFYVNYKK